MKIGKRGAFCLFFACSFLLSSFSHVSAVTNSLPQVQALYGGQISGLNIIEPAGTANQVRLFLKTDFSANSIFYADFNYSLADPSDTNNYSWRVVPDFNAQAGFGTVSDIAAHQASGRLFVADDDGLFSCTTVAGSLVTNISSSGGSMFLTVCIQDSVLLSIASRHGSDILCFGNLDSSGNFTQGAGSPVNIGLSAFSSTAIQLAVNPVNHHVYIIDSYGTNGILKSSATYDALSAATFSRIDISSVITNWVMGRRIGFGPDGRMFIGAKVSSSSINTIAYSDNDGTNWTTVSTGVIGKGENFDTTGSTSQYNVVFGRAVSTNKGAAGSWFALGANDPPGQVRANDSSSRFDPLYPQLMYFASDQGVGCTTNGGPNLKEIDFGLEAVAIQGLDMNGAKTLGWTASASGLRRGVGSAGAVQWESTGMFPMDDSAPYYSVAIDKTDASGNTVYAGNGYIYKTTDGGTNWTRAYMSSTDTSSYMSSLAASGNNVFAGVYEWVAPYTGGLLYSADAGATWHNFALEGTNGINVNKILLTQESGAAVAYIGAEFNTNSSLGGHIYRVTQSGASHILLDSASNISIRDLAQDSAGGIYASGWNPNYQPMVFYKPASSSTWTMLTTNGLSNISFYSTSRGPVITIGRDSSSNDMPVVGAGVDLYYLTSGASTWTTSTNLHYPRGTKLNVIYWDDLLVGTTIGLYGQGISTQAPRADPGMVILSNWYLWLSAMGYQMSGPFNFGASALPVAADFDADGKADPAMVDGALWYIWFTGAGYQLCGGPWNFGVIGNPVAADFDGDRKADPATVVNTLWYIWFSGAGYQLCGGPWNFGVAGYPVAADFDGDGKGDPCMVVGPLWYIWFSGAGYQLCGGPWNFGVDGIPVAADFDADGKADPAMVVNTLWYIWFSGAGYQLCGGPWNFGVAGYPVAADFDGR